MKTLTELSGSVIRTAAAAVAEAKRSFPSDEKSAQPAAPAVSDAPAAEAVSQDAPSAPAAEPVAQDAAAGGEATGDAAAPAEPPASAEAPASPDTSRVSDDAVNAAIEAAIAKATGLSGDRLTMLRGAVEAAGRRAQDVRLVRVFGPEEQVPGATKVGAFQFVVDLFPASMRQNTAPRDDRGRGGGRGGGGGGRGGGGGGGGRGAKAGATGGFSMDSLREDRKNERGGRGPGGGRRPGGGGPRGGGRPGGPAGGGPKK